MSKINAICVFCGASTPAREAISAPMLELADEMLKRNITLVYGGGRVGLMGMAAERVMSGGGTVVGIIPYQLQRREVAHDELSELIVVETMHERKALMYDRSDAFVIYPGGFGTLDEAMEILTWKQLGIHAKPIIFANIDGYYDDLKRFFERAVHEGLIKPDYVPLYHFADDIAGVFGYLERYTPQHAGIMKWA